MTDQQYPVYLGVWTNWSRGQTFGATLTMTRENGNLLIAFVAFFVSYVLTRLWRILCLIAHSVGSSQVGHEGYHHQRQTVVRNASNPGTALVDLFKILIAWTKISKRVWRSIMPLIAIAVLCIVSSVAAGGFSSEISSAMGQEVLLDGSNCAWLDTSAEDGNTLDLVGKTWRPYEAKTWISAANYAQECYRKDGSSGLLGCETFITREIPFTVKTDVACPFSPGICRTNDSNIEIDSGYLDSNAHFGLNAPEDQRIQWRKVMQCAPLVTEGYREDINDSSRGPLTRYHYGKTWDVADRMINFTYVYANSHFINFTLAAIDYTIG